MRTKLFRAPLKYVQGVDVLKLDDDKNPKDES